MSSEEIKVRYPLHYYAWHNNPNALDELLQQKKYDIEALDPHGRTPLMLAVVLDNMEAVRVLLRHNANACFVSKNYWSVSQEAVSTGDPQLLKLVLVHRDAQVVRHQALIMTDLLKKLRETPDFYIEMKWEFTSWLPLVSRMCPSDVCRVWKSGPNVRIDTNLIGFNGSASWIRGHLSYIFRVNENEAVVDEVNHTDRTIYRHNIALVNRQGDSLSTGAGSGVGVGATAAAAAQLFVREPSDAEIANKLTQPVFVTYLDTDKIEFEKSKSGIWGWRSDRKEVINNHNCQVYCASNVQIVTLRRTEHLTEENLRDLNQQRRSEDGGNPEHGPVDIVFPGGHSNLLTNLLQTAAAESRDKPNLDASHEAASYNPNEITVQQYFNMDGTIRSFVDIGRPRSMTTKVKTFKARLWLCRDFPLSLKEQVIPIIELMSEYNPYFHKLKEFLTKQLPTGFPLKIEIPLYHVLNACISFGNIYGLENTVYGVSTVPLSQSEIAAKAKLRGDSGDSTNQPLLTSSESGQSANSGQENVKCVIDETVFDVGKGYHVIVENSPGHYGALDEEEQMVQMAVQRSLIEFGSADNLVHRDYSLMKRGIIEARADEYVEPEEAWLQQAIAASLSLDGAEIPVTSADEAYMKVLEESRLEQEREERRRRQEDDELARVLELSTREK
ncbi:Ankyrin repeat domain-containing protein 13A [Fasciola hepatica]|uniref:Ankyrin repeat domain-containing protein 13A n=1 Tax=Fasciola hepatica TaxID=6192 RepID=A0A4E0RTY0_FASHE|nr:Ankyrin repeat domain-containing protein 13A [Fasciola hepatica]